MIGPDLMGSLAQLGTAGLIGMMWLSERKSAQEHERQIREAHARLIDGKIELEALLGVVRANTAALETIGNQQRELNDLVRQSIRTGADDRRKSERS
ncbi:MAG: hypothetical protein H6815_05320 [Phycisphaeraceae bacterium]|nr:hypothetical protein [Phycisphaerales bacterium]MCB9859857.1 hypothetical protein [Phycisphaeraceae bacterium]